MPAVPASDKPALRGGRWLPLLVLLTGLAMTIAFASWSWHRERGEQLARFDRRVDRFAQALGGRVQSYVDTLPGLRMFDDANATLSDAAFAQYVEGISLQRRFPGLALTFVAERLRGDELAGFVRSVREDRSRQTNGHPDFDVRPPGQRAEHMVIRHVHPAEDGAFGYDLYDPGQGYRAEVDAALRSGSYVATGPIRLARDRFDPISPERTSVVIRAATYRTLLVPASAPERERLAEGVVGIAFRTGELVRSVIPPELEQVLHVHISDRQASEAGQHAEVFDSAWLDRDAKASASGPQRRLTLNVADRRWDVVVGLREGAELHTLDASTALALLLGVLLSTSLAAMTRTLVRAAANEARKVHDATAQLQAEKLSVEQSEQRYRMLFENSLDAVLRTRPDGSVLAANPAACTLFGRAEPELCALGRKGLVDPADPRLGELVEMRERTGRAQGQLRMLRADGSYFEAEVSASTYVDVDGRFTSSLIVRDVTERERTAVRQAQLTAILDATPDFVGSADTQGRLNFLNRAARRMIGLAETDELSAIDFGRCHPAWALRTIVEVGVPAAVRSGVWAGQTAIACADGREIPVSQVIICLRDAQGRITSLATVARDLSDLHAALAQQHALEARLLEAQKMESIGTLAGGVAHDFNNVLAAILGNLSIAREDLGPGHPVQQQLSMAQQAATRARSLVQQILAFSRRLPQERVVQPLAPLVAEALALLRATLPASVQLEARLSDLPLAAEVDAGADPAGGAEPVQQRLAGAAGPHRADQRAAGCRDGRRRRHGGRLAAAGPVREAERGRRRQRHGRGHARAHLRALLHHQAGRPGHGPGAGGGARHRHRQRRQHRRAQCARPGHAHRRPPAASRRGRRRAGRGAARRRNAARPGRACAARRRRRRGRPDVAGTARASGLPGHPCGQRHGSDRRGAPGAAGPRPGGDRLQHARPVGAERGRAAGRHRTRPAGDHHLGLRDRRTAREGTRAGRARGAAQGTQPRAAGPRGARAAGRRRRLNAAARAAPRRAASLTPG